MKKNYCRIIPGFRDFWNSKLVTTMRLTVFALLLGILHGYAIESYAQLTRLNLRVKNSSVKEVLNQIEEQSEFYFLYNSKLVNVERQVDVVVKNKSINELLAYIFEGTGTAWQVIDRQIVLTPSEMSSSITAQQPRQVTGKVTDKSGSPLPGVTIAVKGTVQGTITDANGNYVLTNLPPDAVLVFSFVGMKTLETAVRNQATINVSMEDETIGIDEVIAIGYGTQKKADLTTSISVVSSDEIQTSRVTQLSEALQGTVAGVTIKRDGSDPKGNISDLYIRGITTLSTNAPLVLIDGMPGNLNDVNANDVESMSFLKDAASASIYGSRAAAGVILVTTKRAKTDDLSISYDYQMNIKIPVHLGEYMDVQDYMKFTNEGHYNDNPEGGWYQYYTKDQLENWVERNKTDPDHYPITDIKKLLLKDHATGQRHSVYVAGGSKSVRTHLSYTHDDNDAIIKNNRYYKRDMLRLNNDIDISKYLAAGIDLSFIHDKEKTPADVSGYFGGIGGFVDFYAWDYLWPLVWSDGRYAEGKSGQNAYAEAKNPSFNKNENTTVKAKFSLILTPLEGLKITANFSPDYTWNKGKRYVEATYWTHLDDPNRIGGYFSGFSQTDVTEIRNDGNNRTKQLFANYDKKFGKHSISAIAGYEDRREFTEWFNGDRKKSQITGYPYISMVPDTYDNVNGGVGVNYAYQSQFGRISYNYDNKYLLQANIRRDGSSRFHKDYRWGTFPSVSAGWVISEESFMKNVKTWMSYLKLRASYGELGNERIGNYFPYQSQIGLNKLLLYTGTAINGYQCSYPTQYVIDDISWETTKSTDIGIDTRFLDNRLSLTFDWYKKKTTGMLLPLQIPRYLGFSNPNVNAGDMNTKGWDLELGWRDRIGDFNYQVSANLSDYTSRMGDLKGTQFLGDQIIQEGSEYGEWYGYQCEGIYLTQAEVDNHAQLNNREGVGSLKYKDISGPDGVPDGVISPEYDKTLLGSSSPHYQFGLNLLGSYKHWDVNVMFQGIGKWTRMRSNRISEAGSSTMWGDWCKKGKYWSALNTDEENARAIYPRLYDPAGSYGETSDYWFMNGGYLRLKNVTIGYTLPTSLTNKWLVKNLRFFLTGTDLLTFSNYPKEMDPEASNYAKPLLQSYIFGASIKF